MPAKEASTKAITAFQPASEIPRTRIAATEQSTTFVV